MPYAPTLGIGVQIQDRQIGHAEEKRIPGVGFSKNPQMGGKHRLKHPCHHKKNTWIKTGPRTGFHPSSRSTAYDGKVWKKKK